MGNERDVQKGWNFMTRAMELDVVSGLGEQARSHVHHESAVNEHIREINEVIDSLNDSINHHAYRNLDIAQLKGYIAEEWHAHSFNYDALHKDSQSRASVVHSLQPDSVDIETTFGKDYSLKYYGTPERSVTAQAHYSQTKGKASYYGMERLVPEEQLDDAIDAAKRRAISNESTRPKMSKSYADTASHLTDRISDREGVESRPLSVKTAEKIAGESKREAFDAGNYGFAKEDEIRIDFVKNSIQAGLSAAAVSAILRLAPEIYKAIDHLIKGGEFDLRLSKTLGGRILTASGEGFLRGAAAYALEAAIQQGLLGTSLMNVKPAVIGVLTTVMISSLKDMIGYAVGKKQFTDIKETIVNTVISGLGYLAGMRAAETTAIAFGLSLPGLSFLQGGFLACAISAAYQLGKQKLISLCKISGFTFFGMVDKDYVVPEEIIQQTGIDKIPILQRNDDRRSDDDYEISHNVIREAEYETIRFSPAGRGILAVDHIEYAF